MQKNQNILAIEASTQNWSISIFENSEEQGFRIGDRSVPLSESLLPNIKEILIESGKQITDLDLMAVSTGPGSFTGLRVGIAVCQGIAFSEKIDCIGISYLEILANAVNLEGDLRVFVSLQRDKIYFQDFSNIGEKIVEKSNIEIQELEGFFDRFDCFRYVTEFTTFEKINLKNQKANLSEINLIEDTYLAGILAKIARKKRFDTNERPLPIYF